MRRITAIARVTGELRVIAKVLIAPLAIGTCTASGPEPGNSDSHSGPKIVDILADPIDPPDNFVTGNDRQLRIWQFAVDDMEVSSANATSS